jgi:hypothetical protein
MSDPAATAPRPAPPRAATGAHAVAGRLRRTSAACALIHEAPGSGGMARVLGGAAGAAPEPRPGPARGLQRLPPGAGGQHPTCGACARKRRGADPHEQAGTRREPPSPVTAAAMRSLSSSPADALNRFAANALLKRSRSPGAAAARAGGHATTPAAHHPQPSATAGARRRAPKRSPGSPRRGAALPQGRRSMNSGRRRSGGGGRPRARHRGRGGTAHWRRSPVATAIRWRAPSAGRAAVPASACLRIVTERIRAQSDRDLMTEMRAGPYLSEPAPV